MAPSGYREAWFFDGYDTQKLIANVTVSTMYVNASDSDLLKTVYSLYTNDGNATPTKSGYIFVGWSQYINGDASVIATDTTIGSLTMNDDDYSGTGDGGYNFYAVWEQTIPVITFNANSGTFPTSGETQTTYNSIELTGSTALSSIVETPTKPGYVFQGWSTTSTGTVQYTQASMPTISSDTTLYAIYEPDTTKALLEKGAVDIILGKLK